MPAIVPATPFLLVVVLFLLTGCSNKPTAPIEEPCVLEQAGELQPAVAAWDIHVSGSYAYTTGFMNGLGVLDLTDPTEPEQVGQFNHGPSAFRGVYVQGGTAYVAADGRGLDVIDVSVPTAPSLSATVTLGGWNAVDVAVAGGFAYVANTRGGLEVVSLTNLVSVANELSLDYYVQAVAVHGTSAYIGTNWPGDPAKARLWVYSIADPTAPAPRGWVALPSTPWKVAADGSRVYVGTFEHGVQVIDVSTPTDPQVVGSFATATGDVRGLFIDGAHLFLSDMGGVFYQVDISDPSAPAEVARLEGLGSPRGIWVQDGLAFIVDVSQLRVVTICR